MQILDCRFKILKISLTYLEVKFKMKSSCDLSNFFNLFCKVGNYNALRVSCCMGISKNSYTADKEKFHYRKKQDTSGTFAMPKIVHNFRSMRSWGFQGVSP